MNLEKVINADFGAVRTLTTDDNKVLFVAGDIAKALDYANIREAISIHCTNIQKISLPHPQNPDKSMEMNMIDENDVIRLVAQSSLPNALKFEAWIFDEVIPQVLKTGNYSVSEKNITAMNANYKKMVENYEVLTNTTKEVLKILESNNNDDVIEALNIVEKELNKANLKLEKIDLIENRLGKLEDRMDKIEGKFESLGKLFG